MTRKLKDADHPSWTIRKAKARLSEVVRRAESDGPRHVTEHGRDAAVILSASEYRKASGRGRTGADLVAAMQRCPYPDVQSVHPSILIYDVRDVEL